MNRAGLNWRTLGLPVYLSLALIAVVLVAVIVVMAQPPTVAPSAAPVSADSYRARVDALLAMAHPEDAESIVQTYGCVVCHRDGAQNGLAPSWVGIAARAATRRPPMPAAAYIYQSITDPSAYVVSGFTDVMPKDFAQRLSDQQLADLIAYLLTPDAH